MRRALVLVVLTLASCGKPANEEGAGDAARQPTIAVNTPSGKPLPPAEAFEPQPVAWADIERAGLVGAGCAYMPAGKGADDALLIATSEGAVMKRRGAPVTFTPDPDSPEMPYGTRAIYNGTGVSLEIAKGGGEGEVSGEETVRWPGTITVRDQQHRISYQAAGSLECGA